MKKVFTIIIAIVLLFSCVACGSGDDPTTTGGKQDQPSQTQGTVPSIQETTKPVEKAELDGKTYVGGRDITISYNTRRRKETCGDSIVFYNETTSMIAMAYDLNTAYTGSVEDVFALLNDGDLFDDLAGFMEPVFWDAYPYLIEVVSSEKVNVAGFESIKFIGTVMDDKGKEAEVYGYTFVIDETPCMLVGVILDAASNPDIVAAVRAEIDLMAQNLKEA